MKGHRGRKAKVRILKAKGYSTGQSKEKKDKIVVYSFYPFMKKNETFEKGNITKATMYFINGTLTLLLINRWIVSGHFPLSNLYESLIFLSWSFATIYSITSFTLPSTIFPVIGSSIAPITLLTCAFAFFCVPQELQKAQSLVPALQSNWLIMHVSVMILSYASLLLGSLFALTLLLTKRISKQNLKKLFDVPLRTLYVLLRTPFVPVHAPSGQEGHRGNEGDRVQVNKGVLDFVESTGKEGVNPSIDTPSLPILSPISITEGGASSLPVLSTGPKGHSITPYVPVYAPSGQEGHRDKEGNSEPFEKTATYNQDQETNLKNSNLLDNISYRFIGLGFALLTLGLISGAVWANFAWGSYWSWDPKETWAFITWLTYAFYLHLRISKGWYGEQSAFVAIFGFFVVWFCYLGVNLFGKGLHSYAFV